MPCAGKPVHAVSAFCDLVSGKAGAGSRSAAGACSILFSVKYTLQSEDYAVEVHWLCLRELCLRLHLLFGLAK